MWLDDHPYEMSDDEIYGPRSEYPLPSGDGFREDFLREPDFLDGDDYMEEGISCDRCGREGPRYEIEGHSCADISDLEPA